MSKTYKIKSNGKLFEEWMRVSASPHSKLGLHGASVIQNDTELTTKQLNDWYKEVGMMIKATEEHFESVINEMNQLRIRTVNYITNLNK